MDYMSMSAEMMWVMALVALAIIGALIAFGVWAVRRFTEGSRSGAVRLLEERFARGEIDEEELDKRRRALHG